MKEILLLSSPRSGNTWLRYCIESIFNVPTIGYHGSIIDEIPLLTQLYPQYWFRYTHLVIKRHRPDEKYKECRLIYLERDKSLAVKPERFNNWEVNKNYYENYTLEKALIRYENITGDNDLLKQSLYDVGDLLKLDGNTELFINNIEIHRSICHYIYTRIQKEISITHGEWQITK